MRNKILKLLVATMVITGVSVPTAAQAKSFGLSLAPYSNWRSVDAPDTKDTKDTSQQYGYIKLDKIDDADSYYVQGAGRATVDSSTFITNTPTIKQGQGRVSVDTSRMSYGKTYYLALKNLNSKYNYVWSTGEFGWM